MPPERATNRLLEFLEDEVGTGLRAIVRYSPEAADFVYLREDLQDQVNIQDLEPTIDQVRELHRQLDAVGQLQGQTLGRPVGNIAVFEHALAMVLRYNEGEGVVTTLDRDVGRNLAGFVEHCSDALSPDA